jgi:hypothetical protein
MFSWLSRAFHTVTGRIDQITQSWVSGLISGVYGFLHTIFGDVRGAWSKLAHTAESLSNELDEFGAIVATGFAALFRHWIPGIIKWVTTEVLAKAIAVLTWIQHYGAIIWHYISNTADLVKLIYDALIVNIEATAWDTADKLGSFLLALMYKNFTKLLTLAEDILDAIL